ncbi:hypothetical protein J5N97_006619 [Dioscorea zingiberensis]|uniref:Uncharacterized protein n=1 Tax=Dioscorea zingiberensis TaxID=325984 RepID=A0A9D5HTR0_9LILI|nr:hypothetical protein J5N97_006619 [Dioscorea zingiberensis]
MAWSHHVSMSVDSTLMAEREVLRRCSVATVVKTLKGLGGSAKVTAAAAELFEPGLDWSSELYDDGRILIHCPSEVVARELEKRKEITFPEFIVRFEPWSMDIDPSEKINDEIRWITGEGLPTFGRKIDTVARILKPIGELVHLAVNRPRPIGHFCAMLRIRRGKTFPTTINVTILRRKYLVKVALEPGQTPLPWIPAPERNKKDNAQDEEADRRRKDQAEDDERRRKGKLPVGPEVRDREAPLAGARLEKYGGISEHATRSEAERRVRRRSRDDRDKRDEIPYEAMGADDHQRNGSDDNRACHVAKDTTSDGHTNLPPLQSGLQPMYGEAQGKSHVPNAQTITSLIKERPVDHHDDPTAIKNPHGHVDQSKSNELINP